MINADFTFQPCHYINNWQNCTYFKLYHIKFQQPS